MDNFRIDVTAEKKETFKEAFNIAFRQAPGCAATSWSVSPKHGLTLYWGPEKTATPLPCKMKADSATDFAWNWLCEFSDEKMEPQPDIDGSVKKGFRVYNEAWGHVNGSVYAIVAVLPTWALYGK